MTKDFHKATFGGNTTLRADISFNDGGSSCGGAFGSVAGGIRGTLPSTGGGMALAVLGASVLLVGCGLLIRGIFR